MKGHREDAARNSKESSLFLVGARLARGAEKSKQLDIEVRGGKIVSIGPNLKIATGARRLDLQGCLILPGLINAHDHLEFNLFPRMGHGPYRNAGEWGRDIYRPDRPPILNHLRISLATRLCFGAIKNLLSGVTTVCHHNPYHSSFSKNFLVHVPKSLGWAHSLEFSPDLTERFRETPSDWPFVVHLGEAIDGVGHLEIGRLERLGALTSRTVLVHAVALGRRGLRIVREKGASIVWCPSSNVFILGRTLQRDVLNSGIPVALGTDSALSGTGDLLEEIRFAHRVSGISAWRLYDMVTCGAALVMRLHRGEGTLAEGGVADLLVVKDSGLTPASTLFQLSAREMEMVVVGGRVKLASPQRLDSLPPRVRASFHSVLVGEKQQLVFIAIDVPRIFREVKPILGSVDLAHKSIESAA